MTQFNSCIVLDLRLFDGEGTAPAAAGSGASDTSGVSTSEQEQSRTSFRDLIAGEYKTEADEYIQNIVKSRLKNEGKIKAENDRMRKTLSQVSAKYGLSADDYDGLDAAISKDTGYLKEMAREEGLPLEAVQQREALKAQLAELTNKQKEIDSQNAFNAQVEQWRQESENIKDIYPNFDFEAEFANKEFYNLISRGIDIKTAFEILHKDEILAGGVNYAYNQAVRQTVDNIRSRGNRPAENGLRTAPAADKKPVADTKAKRDELIRRSMAGERVVL